MFGENKHYLRYNVRGSHSKIHSSFSMAKIYGIATGKHFMAERETHSHLIQSIHLLNGSFGQSNKMHKRKTHKLWGFKSINLHLYCWMYMSKGTCMNLNEYVALVHIVPPEPCPLVPPDMGCVKSCITSVHNNFRYFLLFIGPRSDHSLPMSVTHSLTDWWPFGIDVTTLLKNEWIDLNMQTMQTMQTLQNMQNM